MDYDVVLSGPFNTIGTVYVGEERGTYVTLGVVIFIEYDHTV